jgi:uncharacterized protein CbrC (UPF0167 family)
VPHDYEVTTPPRELPVFPYYRDPFGDGTIEQSDERCSACGRQRGFIFTGVASGSRVPDDAKFCPWCISDGTAHRKLGARFNVVGVGASRPAREEVERRTPGFLSWQDWDWPTHCNDVAAYLGQPSGDELRANPPALQTLLADLRQWDWGRDEEYVEEFIDGLGSGHVAYLFECRHCHTQLVRWDAD